jgi:hypothetical protein
MGIKLGIGEGAKVRRGGGLYAYSFRPKAFMMDDSAGSGAKRVRGEVGLVLAVSNCICGESSYPALRRVQCGGRKRWGKKCVCDSRRCPCAFLRAARDASETYASPSF